jgi:glycerophosphoryl diester phosphodiesterase
MKKSMAAIALVAFLGACSSTDKGSGSDAAVLTSPATAVGTTEPATTEPETTEPATTEPATTEPATTEPETTEPETTEPETSEPETTEPETTEPDASTGPLTIQELLDLGRPIVLAHAGGEDEHPHSTPYAYAESVKAGVDMLDFDVQLTADGQLVVQHDDGTGRTTDQDLTIADTAYADLAELDNAYWFTTECTCTGKPDSAYILRGMRTGDVAPLPGYTPDDFIIPRFEDIVERFPNMPVNIEIKGSGANAIAAAYELARILTDHDLIDNAVVTSFDDTVVDAFHELAPDIEVTPGLNVSSAFILGGTPLPEGMRILQLPPVYSGIDVLSPEHIAASHAAGYVIWVWPNDRYYENLQGYASLLDGGMDGLNINFPDQGVQAVQTFVAQEGIAGG